ncbi:MAG: hypothetical protein Q7P63_15265 [Verrucomicrobiota bacterium JB022]|nr:hypothetical protein [Verrucomicrobiota bacterium JB022]
MQDEFEQSVERLRSRPVPPCPAQLEANVLRRVRLEQSEQRADWWAWLSGLTSRPAYALGAFALGIGVSTAVTLFSVSSQADRQAELSRAFGFDALTQTHIVHLDAPTKP